MTILQKRKAVRPSPLYVGQQSCDFRPEWVGLPEEGGPLAELCWKAAVGDHLPWLVLADWLEERADARHEWVRAFVRWEQTASATRQWPTADEWDTHHSSFAKLTETSVGWRWVRLYGTVAARWCPDGYNVGPQHETWTDVRVKSTNTWCVLFACGLAAWSQADAAWRQADAAWSQAYAAWRQADAARSQADAAWSQAYAAWSQAYAAWSQADAAGSQADAAEKRCRKWLMGLWGAMSAELPSLELE